MNHGHIRFLVQLVDGGNIADEETLAKLSGSTAEVHFTNEDSNIGIDTTNLRFDSQRLWDPSEVVICALIPSSVTGDLVEIIAVHLPFLNSKACANSFEQTRV